MHVSKSYYQHWRLDFETKQKDTPLQYLDICETEQLAYAVMAKMGISTGKPACS